MGWLVLSILRPLRRKLKKSLVTMSAHQGGGGDSFKNYDHPDHAKEEQEDFSEHTLEYTVLLSRGPNGLGIKLGTQKGVGNITRHCSLQPHPPSRRQFTPFFKLSIKYLLTVGGHL